MLIPSYRHTWACWARQGRHIGANRWYWVVIGLAAISIVLLLLPNNQSGGWKHANHRSIMLDRGEDGFGFYDWQHQHQHICRNNNNHPSSAASYHVNDNNVMSTVETHTINNMNLFRQWLYPHQLILHTYGRSSTPEEGGGRGIIILTSILVVVILM